MASLQLVSPLEFTATRHGLAEGLATSLASSGLSLPDDRQLLDSVAAAEMAGALEARLAVSAQEALGIAVWHADGEAGFINLLYALQQAPAGTAALLLKAAMVALRRRDIPRGIYAELPGATLEVRQALGAAGFVGVERAIMQCGLRPAEAPQVPPGYRLVAWNDRLVEAAAHLIYIANVGTLDAMIIPELQTETGSRRIVRQAVRGRYGVFDRTASVLMQAPDGHLAGVTLVTRRHDGSGFTAEISVLPGDQRRGIGRALMLHSHRALRAAGVTTNFLGVTAGNPARRLYEALGYRAIGGVSTFVWPRPDGWPG